MARTTQLAIFLSILAVVARLILIDQSYIDSWSWRQSDVAAIARNYFHNGFHFAYPQIDWAGDQPGYVGTEFPILPFLAGLCYKCFGVHEWIGRMQAVILFAVSLPFFFLLIRDTWHRLPADGPRDSSAGCRCHVATWALFFYSFAPLNLFTGREFMPDVPSLSLALIGLYFFLRWIDSDKPAFFAASACAVSLAILIKLPSAVIGAPLAYLAFQRFRFSAFQRFSLWLFAAIALLPSAAWYWHAHAIATKFYPHHFFGAGGIHIESFSWYWKIAWRAATSSLTPVLSVLAMIGLFVAPRERRTHLFHWWLAGMIVFIAIIGYGNRHPWYQLPLVPIAAAFAGRACASIVPKISGRRAKVTLSILLAGLFGLLAFHYVEPLYRSSAAQLRDVGLELKRSTPQNSLIVAADNGDPTIFYYAERKGWHFLEKNGVYEGNPLTSEEMIVDLEKLRRRGATHLVFTTNTAWWLDYYHEFAQYLPKNATPLQATAEFRIYKLNPSTE